MDKYYDYSDRHVNRCFVIRVRRSGSSKSLLLPEDSKVLIYHIFGTFFLPMM